jgi:hypothetical protein
VTHKRGLDSAAATAAVRAQLALTMLQHHPSSVGAMQPLLGASLGCSVYAVAQTGMHKDLLRTAGRRARDSGDSRADAAPR